MEAVTKWENLQKAKHVVTRQRDGEGLNSAKKIINDILCIHWSVASVHSATPLLFWHLMRFEVPAFLT